MHASWHHTFHQVLFDMLHDKYVISQPVKLKGDIDVKLGGLFKKLLGCGLLRGDQYPGWHYAATRCLFALIASQCEAFQTKQVLSKCKFQIFPLDYFAKDIYWLIQTIHCCHLLRIQGVCFIRWYCMEGVCTTSFNVKMELFEV